MSVSSTTTTSAVRLPATGQPGWRRLAAGAAIGAPLAELLAVAFGVQHTSDDNRQLDIINAHHASFIAMVLLEEVCYVLAAVVACALALGLVSRRGGRIAAFGAVLTVVGSAASLGGFGGALPVLAKPEYRDAGLYFTDHLGTIYGVAGALSILLDLGLVVVLVALWRSGRVAWPWLAVALVGLVASAVVGTGRVENVLAMLMCTAGFVGIARFLAQPAVNERQA